MLFQATHTNDQPFDGTNHTLSLHRVAKSGVLIQVI